MVADEGERDNANGLEYFVVDEQAAFELPANVVRLHRTLSDNREDDDHHADESKRGRFGQLRLHCKYCPAHVEGVTYHSNISVQRQGIGQTQDHQYDDRPSICE